MAKPLHLQREKIVNFGSYYTDQDYVEIVWDYIKPYIGNHTVIFDPACGYGNFLHKKTFIRKIGNDIDEIAIKIAREERKIKDVKFYNFNALHSPCREKYHIFDNDFLIIIGNPPYNDTTSYAKKRIKKIEFPIDIDLKTRDIGISFLRMFDKLKADIVCVLHPLSYLVKRTNFHLLKNFKDNYILLNTTIISSKIFNFTSKNSEFPIVIALYRRDNNGMDFEYIKNFKFKTLNGKVFSLSDFDYIGNYINKYPKKNVKNSDDDIFFYTLRDINALRRNKTFIDKPINNAVKVNLEKLDYYIYVDVFKSFIDFIPYYLRNLDIIFDNKLFKIYKKYFISFSLKRNVKLRSKYSDFMYFNNDTEKIKEYLKKLLKEHYCENS